MRLWIFIVVAAVAIAPAGCGKPADEGLAIAVPLYPFAWLASEVAPEADVILASSGSGDPHDLQLSPSEVSSIRRADVVLHLGPIDYQPEFEAAAEETSGREIEALDVIDPVSVNGDPDAVDPHVWQSPGALGQIALRLGAALGEIDPPNAQEYDGNARSVARQLGELEAEAGRRLGDCRLDRVVVSHAGYAYLLQPLGVAQLGVSGAGGHGEPTAQELDGLVESVRSENLPAVVTEPDEGRRAAETVADQAGVPVLEVHPLGSVTDEQARRGYPDLWRENVDAFALALDCPAEGS